MPFAGLEVLAVGVALLVFARHATDRESIRLRAALLTVEQRRARASSGASSAPTWVRVEPGRRDGSLVELSARAGSVRVGRFVRPELRRQLARGTAVGPARWQCRRSAGRPERDHETEVTTMKTIKALACHAGAQSRLTAGPRWRRKPPGRERPARRPGREPARPAPAGHARSPPTSTGCTTSCWSSAR